MLFHNTFKRFLVGLLTVGILGGEVVANTGSPPQRHVVQIQAFSFQPPLLDVLPGDKVVWVNSDIVPHFVSVADGKWQSAVLEEGQSWEMTVDEVGCFGYLCVFHPKMTGEVKAHEFSTPEKG